MVAPTLLVGLGGTGSKIVCRVANMVSSDQRNRIGYAVFDTDINELRGIEAANPFVTCIQTSTNLSVGESLNIDEHARNEWFPMNQILDSKTLTEGAGQVRATSRLAFEMAVRAGLMDKLHFAIENLYKVESTNTEQALRVVIVSSLAGGTGSGLIVPVALYIRNFLKTRFQQSANIMRGFFLMPEIFFEVIRGQTERNNLMCNAYATIRELDAFLMKGDGTLNEKYMTSVKLDFPRVGTDTYDEYMVRPYDFCFLFDAQNTAGRKLNNFAQYIEHAANCIYSQSIGPMNKRSNSSEDNTIRDLCAQRGRNRYAGAGSAMLVYPVEDIKEYIALKWAQQTISDQWLKFDRIYMGKVKELQKQRAQGVVVQEITAADDYLQTVDTLDSQKDPFAISILDQCKCYDESGLNRTGSRVDHYINALFDYVEQQGNLECSARADATKAIQRIEGGNDSGSSILDADAKVRSYKKYVDQFCNSATSSLAYTIFRAQGEKVTKEKKDYQLETYLRGTDGSFMHPNAVRYFLYQSQKTIERHIQTLCNDIEDHEAFFKGFDGNYDDPNTEQIETVEQFVAKKIPIYNRLSKTLTQDQADVKDRLSGFVEIIVNYHKAKLKLGVLREGLNYINSLILSFESFYNTFEAKISMIERRMNEISKRYQNCAGKTTRYICASSKCMNTLSDKIPYTGSAIRIDGDLADEIYSKVRIYAQFDEDERPGNGRYFNELFDETIIGYYKKKMMESYGSLIDMDIISAMEREIEIEEGEYDPARISQITENIIYNTRKMSTPFIERPLGEQVEPISACTYHPSIDPHDDSPRAGLIAKELNNYGGTPDSDIGKNMIIFYQSIYGLRANRLSKFAPAREGICSEGMYHKAYFELVRQIVPALKNIPIITPHIHKGWHLVANMPDLDEVDQKDQEMRIYKAFLLGLIYGIIKQKPVSSRDFLYKLELSGSAPESFVVSNHTPCDLFYEVLDALTINPLVVDRILDEVQRLMKKELNSKVSFKTSQMCKLLKKFSVTEYEAKKKMVVRFKLNDVSIFDFPSLLSVSSPDNAFTLDMGTDIVRVALDIFHDYIASMTDANHVDEVFGEFVVEQYRQFTKTRGNFELYDNLIWFMSELKRVAIEYLRHLDLDENAQEIEDIETAHESTLMEGSVSGVEGSESASVNPGDSNEDYGEDETNEVNDIAGDSNVRASSSEPMISLAEHNAEVEELKNKLSKQDKAIEKLTSMVQSLSLQMSQVRSGDAEQE